MRKIEIEHRKTTKEPVTGNINDMDSVLAEAGSMGLFQILLLAASLFILSFVGANMGASIFEAMTPEVKCKSPHENAIENHCPHEDIQQFLVPETTDGLSKCHRFNYSSILGDIQSLTTRKSNKPTNCREWFNQSSANLVECTEWEFDQSIMKRTIVTDFKLVCDNKWAGHLTQSTLMIGVAIGSMVSGYISDRIGRRNALLFSCIGTTIFGTALSFTTSYLAYGIVRTLVGFFSYGPFPILFVLNSEMTVPKYRSVVAQVLETGFPIGFSILSLFAYVLREWKSLQLVISAPFVLGIVMWWIMPESPRWLIEKKQKNKAEAVIKTISNVNQILRKTRENAEGDGEALNDNIEEVDVDLGDTHGIYKQDNAVNLFRRKNMRTTSFKLFYNWFAVSCVYYGLTLNAAELDGDPFRNLFLNAIAEVIACILTVPLVNLLGRRMTGFISEVLSGLMCILVVVIPGGDLPIAIIGKFAISVGFGTMYIHANEIYPTSVRTLGICICNAMARLGGVISPIIAISGSVAKHLPYSIFGILSVLAGVSVLTLPETKGVALPQTIEEGEKFAAENRNKFSSICKHKKIKKPTGGENRSEYVV